MLPVGRLSEAILSLAEGHALHDSVRAQDLHVRVFMHGETGA